MKTEVKSSLKLFMRPSLVVLAFMLLYALAHAALGFYVKKDSAPISQNLEKTEMERQNSALSPKEEANATTTATMGKKPLEYKVAVSGVNVRAFPSIKGKIIGSLLKDKSVKVLEIQNDWAKIEFSHETKGYVFLKLLKKAE